MQAVRAGTSAVDCLKYRLYLPTYQPQFPRTHLPLLRPDYGPVFARLLSVRHRFLPLRIRPPDSELENSPFLELTNQDAPPGTQAIVGGGKLDAIMPAFRVLGSYDEAAVRHKGPSSKLRGPSMQSAPTAASSRLPGLPLHVVLDGGGICVSRPSGSYPRTGRRMASEQDAERADDHRSVTCRPVLLDGECGQAPH